MTVHHPNHQIHLGNRPSRCLRHSVWMAVCDDCREERAERVRQARTHSAPAR